MQLEKKAKLLEDLNVLQARKRPASWLQQLVGSFIRNHDNKQAMVHPCIINGKQTLVYERGLAENDQVAFRLVREFALSNGYQLKEDQRADFLEGIKRVKNIRCANTISVLVLSAGLISQTAHAKSSHDHNHYFDLDHHNAHEHIEHDIDFDWTNFETEDALMSGLIKWINKHSSFEFDASLIPDVKKVSAEQIAEVAFGGKLPKAVDAKSLKILGLYNFNEKAVYLLDSIDLDTTQGKGILLHELVHYLQYQTGVDKDAACMNELESLAYLLEAKFLESQHHKHDITSSHIHKVSQCRV
ncbi:MAG: DUF6647 family protein [Pseudomonadota bacterium]